MSKTDPKFLISAENYLQHINDKIILHGFLEQLIYQARCLNPPIEDEGTLNIMEHYSEVMEKMFSRWNIPGKYLVDGDIQHLHALVNKELIRPEDAGYRKIEETPPAVDEHSELWTIDALYEAEPALKSIVDKALHHREQGDSWTDGYFRACAYEAARNASFELIGWGARNPRLRNPEAYNCFSTFLIDKLKLDCFR